MDRLFHNTAVLLQLSTIPQSWFKEEEGGTCRTLVPTLFLKPYDLGVRAKAVPRSAVVDSLEVSWDNVTHGQCRDYPIICVDSLNSVATRCSRLQHSFLPWPGLRKDRLKRLYVLCQGRMCCGTEEQYSTLCSTSMCTRTQMPRVMWLKVESVKDSNVPIIENKIARTHLLTDSIKVFSHVSSLEV